MRFVLVFTFCKQEEVFGFSGVIGSKFIGPPVVGASIIEVANLESIDAAVREETKKITASYGGRYILTSVSIAKL